MARTDIWMPIYIGDYLADTSRLTTEQHGAYLLLLMDYWRKGPLPNSPAVLAQITKMSPDAWSNAQAILMEFFELKSDGKLHQKRADAELALALKNQEKRTEKARNAAAARWPKGEDAPSNAPSITPSNAREVLEQCPSPSPLPLKTNTTANPDGFLSGDYKTAKTKRQKHKPSTDEVERVRLAYPLKRAPGAARKAIEKAFAILAARGESDPASFLIGRIAAWRSDRDRRAAKGEFVSTCPYPASWFNGECYDEESLLLAKNCILPGGVVGTEAELQAKTGWTVMRGVA
jgi:uncharacterized protein YdaU (DUF1376 family)